MDTEIITKWNSKVAPEDVVYHLGDFCFEKDGRDYWWYANQLNGQIVIIKGNHDSKSTARSVLTKAFMRFGGKEIYMSHEPMIRRQLNLCGHVHNMWKIVDATDQYQPKKKKFIVNVGVDVWDFYPIEINDILELVKKQ
jgi:calcineurin-like phosphoesterase family protein